MPAPNAENGKRMKSKKIDPRHLERKKAVKALFAHSFDRLAKRKKTLPEELLAKKVIRRMGKINKIISQAAPKWPLEKINRVDLAVLRLAVWELVARPKVPPKVVINEAIELAKEYGGENSPSFVNGVLGTVYQALGKEEEIKDKKETKKKKGKKEKE